MQKSNFQFQVPGLQKVAKPTCGVELVPALSIRFESGKGWVYSESGESLCPTAPSKTMSAGEESGPFTRESVYYDADEVQAKQSASTSVFKSVANAGRLLASHLSAQYLNTNTNPVSVIALSKNAMPMAKEIAQHLDAPLDFIGIQVISVEYTGALMWVALCGPGGAVVYDDALLNRLQLSRDSLVPLVEMGCKRAQDVHHRYAPEREWLPVGGRTVIFVMDPMSMNDSQLWPPLNEEDQKKISELKLISAADKPLDIVQWSLTGDHFRLLTAAAQFTCTKQVFNEKARKELPVPVPDKMVVACPVLPSSLMAAWMAEPKEFKTISSITSPIKRIEMGYPDAYQCLYCMEDQSWMAGDFYELEPDITDRHVSILMDEALEFGYHVVYGGNSPAIGGESLVPGGRGLRH